VEPPDFQKAAGLELIIHLKPGPGLQDFDELWRKNKAGRHRKGNCKGFLGDFEITGIKRSRFDWLVLPEARRWPSGNRYTAWLFGD
jgi:hypothetical protein